MAKILCVSAKSFRGARVGSMSDELLDFDLFIKVPRTDVDAQKEL